MASPGLPSDGADGTSEPSRTQPLAEYDIWDDLALEHAYILEPGGPVPLPTMLPSERKRIEDDLRLLSSFVRPLSPEEQAERAQAYQPGEGGYLTRDMIILAMLEVDAGWT